MNIVAHGTLGGANPQMIELETPIPVTLVIEPVVSLLDTFLMECHRVCAEDVPEITGLRKRAKETGLTVGRMRLAAAAASVQIVADGEELKVVPLFTRKAKP